MGKNQQVLLVDADVDHRAQLKGMLSGMAYAVVGEASYGVEAVRLASELRPEIVLLHVEEPLSLAFRTLESVQRILPSATPVVISRRTDAEIARKTMLAGARGFAISPATEAELDQVLTVARERHEALFRDETAGGEAIAGSIITVFGPKGGVGKTTLSTNLAISLRRLTAARVAVVDLDSYFGDVAIMMGAEPERTLADLLEAMHRGLPANPKDFLTHHISGVDVLAAPRTADKGPQLGEADISRILRGLAITYDFVIVDTPGAFSPLVAAALDESALVLMVTSTDISSIKDARLSLDVLRESGFDDDRLKLIVNHATNANSVSEADIRYTVNYGIYWSVPHDRAVPVSTQHGVPIVLSHPRAPMSGRIEGLAESIAGPGVGSGHRPDSPSRRFAALLFGGR